MKVAWLSTWDRRCGIADYSKVLWPLVESLLKTQGIETRFITLDSLEKGFLRFNPEKVTYELFKQLKEFNPDLIHFQHEYGIWGGKSPPFYVFPKLVTLCREKLPQARLLSTAHNVLEPYYTYPLNQTGFEFPIRWILNHTLILKLRKLWREQTWGNLDGVLVHSALQVPWLPLSQEKVKVLPHYVPELQPQGSVSRESFTATAVNSAQTPEDQKTLLVFGFISPEKGQDLAIQALQHLPKNYRLILAGSPRRKKDERFLEQSLYQAEKLGVYSQIEVTGYVEPRLISNYYKKATLVLAPFRETTGSGSLAQAFARNAPLLVSDLPLNRELLERAPGCLSLFKSGDPLDLAQQIQKLTLNPNQLENLKRGSQAYASRFSPRFIAQEHVAWYLHSSGQL